MIGCAGNKYEKTLDTWMGHDVNELINAWGPPSSTFDMPDGHKMYTWAFDGGAQAFSIGNNAYAVKRGCVTTFTVGASGKVETWRYEGNAC
jgi:hypothetical protein